MNLLQQPEESSEQARHAHHRRDLDMTSSTSLGGLGTGSSSGRGCASSTGVGNLALADVVTLDGGVVLEAREVRALLGKIAGGLDVECTLHILEAGELDIREVAIEVDGTNDLLQIRESIDLLELRVVSDGETTTNTLQERQGDVGELSVGDERQILADRGEVGADELKNVVTEEAHGAVDLRKRRDGDGRAVAEGHVVGPDHVGEGDIDTGIVGLESKGVANIAELQGDVVEVSVVCNVESINSLQIDTLERAELSVLDVNGGSLGDS